MSTSITSTPTTVITGIQASGSPAIATTRPANIITLSTSSSTSSFIDIASSSTLSPSATALAPPLRNGGCGLGILTFDNTFPACGLTDNSNLTIPVFRSCCRSAPIVQYNANCGVYCEARNQTLEQLSTCIRDGYRDRNVSYIQGPLCNRIQGSYYSLQPENTADPATRTTPTRTATSAAATSTGASSKLSVRPLGEGVSVGAWATVALLFVGGFASIWA